ncbi:MAG: hypothetical protein ABW137_04315 [Mycobacterium sp.]
MRINRIGAVAAVSVALFSTFVFGIAPAGAEPGGCPAGATVDGDACSARLTSVTAKDFTITGTLVGSQPPVTLSGQPASYLPSSGFATPPDTVQEWDATIERVNSLDPADPNWYGNGKAKAFLPTELNRLATQFPPEALVVRFVPDESNPAVFQLLSVQPTA